MTANSDRAKACRLLRRAPLLVAVLTAAGLAGEGRADEPACPPDHLVRLDVAAWVRGVRAARTVRELDAALARVGLDGVNASELCEGTAQRPPSVHVDDFRPRLADGGAAAHLVQVLASVCETNAGGWQVQRAAVLLPRADGALCRIDVPILDRSGSGFGPALCDPAVFAFSHLTSAEHVAVEVTETDDWCGTAGTARGIERTVSFWELRGAALSELLRVTTESTHYNSPTPPIKSFNAEIELSAGAYPRTVKLTEVTECEDQGDDPLAREEFEQCRPGTVRKTCVLDGTAYACKVGK